MALKNKVSLIVAGIALLSAGLGLRASAIEFNGEGLSEDGTFHVDMAPPKNEVEQYVLNEMIGEKTHRFGITSGGEWGCNEAFTSCKLVDGSNWTEESYGITYIYDAEAEEVIDNLMDSLTFPDEGFFVSDLDLLKYLVQAGMAEEVPLLPAFSSELRTFIGNRNLDFEIDVRMGGYDPLMDFQGGMAKVYYNGTLYNVYDGNVMVYAPHIFYVESDAENYAEALKERIIENYGSEIADMIMIDDELNQTVQEFYAMECANDMYCEEPEEYFDSYTYVSNYLDSKVYGICPQVVIDGEQMGICYNALIVADSSKLTRASGINSTDLLTDINITTTATNLPGDAVTYAENLGSDDEKIAEDFDDKFYAYELGLRSASFNENVSDSDKGFTVTIPVPEILDGVKAISAYWKNFETGELEEHPGKIANGKVTFKTTHFSTYILAEATGTVVDDESEESEDDIVVPKAPDTGVEKSGLNSVMVSLPVFGAVLLITGAAAFIVTKKR